MKNGEKTAAEVLRDPAAAKRTKQQRIDYFNMPEVRRALAIERAEKQDPIVDVPRRKPN
jgi:hypothetical protein